MAKASDNEFPKLIGVEQGSDPAAPAAGTRKFYAKADGWYDQDDAGVVTGPLGVASAGGGSGSGGFDRRWTPGASETTVDEFNDDSLDASWVRVDGTGAPVGNVSWTEGADVLSMVQSSGDTSGAAGHALLRPIGSAVAAGDAFVAGVQPYLPSGNYPSIGIILADGTTFGSGDQLIAALGTGATTSDLGVVTWGYTGFNTRATLASSSIAAPRNAYAHLRLVCTAANTWRTDISPDGIGWMTWGAALAKTFTPTHVGFFTTTFGQSDMKHAAVFDYLRRVSGIS